MGALMVPGVAVSAGLGGGDGVWGGVGDGGAEDGGRGGGEEEEEGGEGECGEGEVRRGRLWGACDGVLIDLMACCGFVSAVGGSSGALSITVKEFL